MPEKMKVLFHTTNHSPESIAPSRLARKLNTIDAVVMGLGAMACATSARVPPGYLLLAPIHADHKDHE